MTAKRQQDQCQTAIRAIELETLPGGALVRQGLDDLRRGTVSVPGLLVQSFAPRLQRLKLDVPADPSPEDFPEHRLYRLLRDSHGDAAHGRYNALMRTLVSFARAAECVS